MTRENVNIEYQVNGSLERRAPSLAHGVTKDRLATKIWSFRNGPKIELRCCRTRVPQHRANSQRENGK